MVIMKRFPIVMLLGAAIIALLLLGEAKGEVFWVMQSKDPVYTLWSDGRITKGPPNIDPYAMYGKRLMETSGILLFDSGAMLSLLSPLKYIPNYITNTVFATLASGIMAQTNTDGTATITYANGTTETVYNIFKSWQSLKNDVDISEDGKAVSADYLTLSYGMLYEGKYKTDYLSKEYNYDEATGSYSSKYEAKTDGTYSSVSLKTDYGYIYEGEYASLAPQKFVSDFEREKDGSYQLEYEGSYDQTYATNSAYNIGKGKTLGAYTSDSHYAAEYKTEYSYDAKTKTYKGASEGEYASKYDSERGDGKDNSYDDKYKYKTEHTSNENSYQSTTRYEHEDGRRYTYASSYDEKAKTYTYIYTDDNTGESKTYIYKY